MSNLKYLLQVPLFWLWVLLVCLFWFQLDMQGQTLIDLGQQVSPQCADNEIWIWSGGDVICSSSAGGLNSPAGNGIVVHTGSGSTVNRTITAGSSKVSIGNGDGVSANPTVDVTEANLTLSNIGGAVTDSQVPDTITIDAATALSANGTNCSANEFNKGVDASGNAESCAALVDDDVPDTITASNYLPLAGGTMTGQLVTDNLGVEFEDSDTNPSCAAGNYSIYADLSETTLKKCVNGSVTDLDESGSPPGADTQVIFNDSGSFGADSGLTFDKTNERLGISLPSGSPSVSLDIDDRQTGAGVVDIIRLVHGSNVGDGGAISFETSTTDRGRIYVNNGSSGGGVMRFLAYDSSSASMKEIFRISGDNQQFVLSSAVAQADLNSSASDGSFTYCSDCNQSSSPCTGGGSGTFAFRVQGAWECPF